MNKYLTISAVALMGMCVSVPAYAEDPEPAVSMSVGADVVSAYLWRGQECGGFSVQPSFALSFNKAHLSLEAWASAELFTTGDILNMTEFDLTLSWNPVEPLSVGLTDFYFVGGDYFGRWNFGSNATHRLEGSLSYDFGPLALAWNTVLTGNDYRANGNRAYSTYAELTVPWKLSEVEGSLAVGALLWDDAFTTGGSEGFKVCNVALTANKELFHLPFMGQIVANPMSDRVYFIVGLTF